MLKINYDLLDEYSIRSMGKEELQDAVIRLFSVYSHKFAETDSWYGEFYLPDDLADAFRGVTKENNVS